MNAKKHTINTVNGTVELDISGRYFKLLSASAAIDVELLRDGNSALYASAIEAGFYQRVAFNKVRISYTGVQSVSFLVAPEEGGSDRFTGIMEILQGANILNVAEKTVGVAEGQVAAASSTRKSLRFRAPSTNTDNIYLGATGVTVSNGCVMVQPGETWVESDGAGAAWFAISGTAAQALRVQEVS